MHRTIRRGGLMAVLLATALALAPTLAFAHGASHSSAQHTAQHGAAMQEHDSYPCGPGNGTPNCNGMDPQATNCAADATTIATFVVKNSSGQNLAYNELRWSNQCGTNWVRMTASIYVSDMIAEILNYCYSNPSYQKEVYSVSNGTVIWSPMVYARFNGVTMFGYANGYTASRCY